MKIADDTTLVRKIERQDGAIAALDWSPDGTRIAVAGASPASTFTTPIPANEKQLAKDTRPESTPSHSRRMENNLATGGFDGKVRIYNTGDCSLLHSFVPVPLSPGPEHTGAAAQ